MLNKMQKIILIGLAGLVLSPRPAKADDKADLRCSQKINIALVNSIGPMEVSGDPKKSVDALLESKEFIENFARFINASFNDDPGATAAQDSPYYLIKYILSNKKKYTELFTGHYNLQGTNVVDDPQGVGYFKHPQWMFRYAGNEPNGIRITTAYRILNNMTGLELSAVTVDPKQDNTATGRKAQPCSSCHYSPWFALDKVASVLGKVELGPDLKRTNFLPPDGTPKEILNGLKIKNLRELTEALAKSENFYFQSCRLAYRYLNGRNENTCDEKLFDQCMKTFRASGMIQDALKTYINDASFCH